MKHALTLSCACSFWLASSSARAQAPAAEPEPLTVEVDGAEGVDPGALEEALEADLGIDVRVVTEGDASARLLIAVGPDGTVRMQLTRDGHTPLARETAVPRQAGERTVAIALLAANLVRDESLGVVAMLRLDEPAREEPVQPAPADPIEPEPATSDRPEAPFGIDFAPGVGVSSALWGRERRSFSLGVVGALHGGLDGLALSSVLDVSLGSVNGAQLAGVLAMSEGLDGVQLASTIAIANGDARGLQGGVVSVTSGALEGVQLGVVDLIGGGVRGAQIGVINAAGRSIDGGQLGVVNAAAGEVHGAQIGVIDVAADRVNGAQIGVVNIAARSVEGGQLGVVNVAAEDVGGAQIGVVNIAAGRVNGAQIGVVNIAEDADASVGLIGIHPGGRTQLRAGGDSTGIISASVVHGTDITHSILSVGVQPFQDRPAFLAGVGFGARASFDEAIHLDFDGLAHVVVDDLAGNAQPGLLVEARVTIGATLIDVFGIYGGIAYQLYVAEPSEGGFGGPIGEHSFGSDVRGWPALFAGIELL